MGINEIIKIGDYLKKIRLENNLTQEEFAKKLNVTRTAYANYEKNLREPNKKVLDSLSNIFNVDLLELIISENSTLTSLKPSIDTKNSFEAFLSNYLSDRTAKSIKLLYPSNDDIEYLFNQCFSLINNFYDYKEKKYKSDECNGTSESDILNKFINDNLD